MTFRQLTSRRWEAICPCGHRVTGLTKTDCRWLIGRHTCTQPPTQETR